MILFASAVFFGLLFLVLSADRFVNYAAKLSGLLGVSQMLIGMFIVGLGTSMPEILVSVMASLQGNPNLALGNVLGSNISNIGLILGITALIIPVVFRARFLRREMLILLAISLWVGWMMSDLLISRVEGLLSLLALLVFLWFSVRYSIIDPPNEEGDDDEQNMSTGKIFTLTLVALLVLVVSARVLVWGAVGIAESLGISDLVIGLTVLAIGTSLPELSSSIAAARRHEYDMLIGGIIGSNVFNSMVVLGVAAMIAPITAEADSLERDWPIMVGFTLALALFGLGVRGGLRRILHTDGRINRLEAAILLLGFTAYMGMLVMV